MRNTLPNADRNEASGQYIGANIMTLAGPNRNLLPDRMDAKRIIDDIVFYIDGRAVARFEQKPLFEFPTFTRPEREIYGDPVGLDLQVDVLRAADDVLDVYVQRDWETILTMEVEIDRVESPKIEYANHRAKDDELDALHNYLHITCGNAFEKAGDVTLIDRMAFVDGSQDPRLMKLFASLDAKIESQVVANKLAEIEARQQAADAATRRLQEQELQDRRGEEEVSGIVNDFFSPET